MKKVVLLILFVAGMIFSGQCQENGIRFEKTKEWAQILKQAKREKKLVFVDCYTSWCIPCKKLSNDVFTRDSVGEFFNRNFVNVKYDMEKDADGVILKTKFGITAYPTLIFVDPKTQEIVHKMIGAGSAGWLLDGARAAIDPRISLRGLTKRYEGGERNPEFLYHYSQVLAHAYLKRERYTVILEYLDALPIDELAKDKNWGIVLDNVGDPLCKPVKKIVANMPRLKELRGEKSVMECVDEIFSLAVRSMVDWRPGQGPAYDEARDSAIIQCLLELDSPSAPGLLANLYTAAYARKGDFRGMLDKMREVHMYNLFHGNGEMIYFLVHIRALYQCDDQALIREGIDWVDARNAEASSYLDKASLLSTKVKFLTQIGDTEGAEKAKVEEEGWRKKMKEHQKKELMSK